jgi:exodeoxyribonuclease VII small subunit
MSDTDSQPGSDSGTRSSPKGSDAASTPRFQDAIAEVESITARIEQGEIGLEDSIDQYEKGMELLARCREILARTEQRVEDITERLRETDTRPKGDSNALDDQDATR